MNFQLNELACPGCPIISLLLLFRFHVVASKGSLDCLNTILIHGVDIVATDVAGMVL